MVEDDHVSAENGPKRGRGSVLDHFQQLGSENEARRLKNAILLVKHLCFSENSEDELKYALNRLVRGLGASRNAARAGFYATLVAVVNVVPGVGVGEVLESVRKQLQAAGSYSKGEVGDVYTGQVLACGALMRSNAFVGAAAEQRRAVLEQLLKASKKRSYLAMPASSFIVASLKTMNREQLDDVWPVLKSEALKSWAEQTVDGVHLLVHLQRRFPQVLRGSALRKAIGTREIFCEENVAGLCDVLMNIPSVAALKHPAYATLSSEIATSNITLPFAAQLDGHLAKPNRNKLIAAAIVLRNILANLVEPSAIPQLLTKNFVSQTLQYYRTHHGPTHDDEFHANVTKFLDALVEALKKENVASKTRVAVLKAVLFYPGTFTIENVTKSKIVQRLVQTLDAEAVKKLAKLYKEVIVAKKDKVTGDDATESWLNAERTYAAQLLVKLLGHPTVQNETVWKLEWLKLLVDMSLIKSAKYENVGVELANSLREIFFRALDQRFPKLEDMHRLLLELANHLDAAAASDSLKLPLADDEASLFRQMRRTTSQPADAKHVLVFQILFLQMGLQLFRDKEMAAGSLRELFQCYERLEGPKKGDHELRWIEVVVDVFLNLLSHNSHLLRNVICAVFPYLCEHVDASAMHEILAVLDPNAESPLVQESDDSDVDGDEEEKESSEEENDDGDDEQEEEGLETTNDRLRMAVRQALGTNGYQTDEESVDLDEMSDTEGERLDEALARAFKQYKPNRGRSKKQRKSDQALTHFRARVLDLLEIYIDSAPSMMSTLEIMLALLQLLEFTIRDEHQRPLQHRVKACLKKLTSLRKFSAFDDVTEVVLGDMLESLLGKGTKSAMMIQDMSEEISECCMFVVRCSQFVCAAGDCHKKLKKRLKQKLIDTFTDAIRVYFNQRDCLIPYPLFKSLLQLNWDGILQLAPQLFEYTFSATTRPFRRSQALELLKLFYLNRRLEVKPETFKTAVGAHEALFCERLVETVDEFCKNQSVIALKERAVYHIFNLLKAMASHPTKNEDIDWKRLGDKIREYRSHVTLAKDAKTAYNQLCAKLNVPHVVKMQSKVVRLKRAQEDEEKPPPQPRQKIQEDNKRKRKETKDLRAKSSSEGFEPFSFSNVSVGDFNGSLVNGISENGLIANENEKKGKRRKESDGSVTHKKKKVK